GQLVPQVLQSSGDIPRFECPESDMTASVFPMGLEVEQQHRMTAGQEEVGSRQHVPPIAAQTMQEHDDPMAVSALREPTVDQYTGAADESDIGGFRRMSRLLAEIPPGRIRQLTRGNPGHCNHHDDEHRDADYDPDRLVAHETQPLE